MHRAFLALASGAPPGPISLPGLRPGVVLIGEGESAELRDPQLGQVVKLGAVAAGIVAMLDGARDAEGLLRDVGTHLSMDLDPMGLLELLQALDRRALLDTPRARMIAAQGLLRADVAALQRLSRRSRIIDGYDSTIAAGGDDGAASARVAEASHFSCHSCTKCCSEKHLLGPVTRSERDAILKGFRDNGNLDYAAPANFIPLSDPAGSEALFLLRAQDGHCVFLQEDGLCRVHKELGEETKPAVCRLFPFRAVRTPQGWDMGMSLSCPTVAMGRGPDPTREARRTLTVLLSERHLLRQLPDRVPLTFWRMADYSLYADWEREALEHIRDPATDPASGWLRCIRAFYTLSDRADLTGTAPWDLETRDNVECETIELSSPPTEGETSQFVPAQGIGTTSDDVGFSADILLRDVALWSELLVGLEAADPQALQRFRRSLHRLRSVLGAHGDDAPVLAELARLEGCRGSRGDADDTLSEDSDETVQLPTSPALHRVTVVSGNDDDVQRRFLTQALFEKRLFDFSSIRRGLIAVTLFLAVMRLEEESWDNEQCRVSDLAYLLHHPQLTDIIDSRAAVRQDRAGASLHSTLLSESN